METKPVPFAVLLLNHSFGGHKLQQTRQSLGHFVVVVVPYSKNSVRRMGQNGRCALVVIEGGKIVFLIFKNRFSPVIGRQFSGCILSVCPVRVLLAVVCERNFHATG